MPPEASSRWAFTQRPSSDEFDHFAASGLLVEAQRREFAVGQTQFDARTGGQVNALVLFEEGYRQRIFLLTDARRERRLGIGKRKQNDKSEQGNARFEHKRREKLVDGSSNVHRTVDI